MVIQQMIILFHGQSVLAIDLPSRLLAFNRYLQSTQPQSQLWLENLPGYS